MAINAMHRMKPLHEPGKIAEGNSFPANLRQHAAGIGLRWATSFVPAKGLLHRSIDRYCRTGDSSGRSKRT